ncbi:Uncharacterized protein Fot_43313 [Forsythia ovata]|uniref:Uncharacterized protein n=1 Tax=Forsythia ovata TaxID=205694 RepID=A0ABD1RPD4_9LAMI
MFPYPIPINPQPATESDPQTVLRHPIFDCLTVNGVLFPEPISWALPDETPVQMEMEEQPRTSSAEEEKGKRTRTKAVVDKVETVMFQLFKTLIKGKEGYILQMHKYFIHSHGKAKKTFRSIKELGNFILFCSSVEASSHRRKAKMTEEEKKEAFLAEANQNRKNMDEMVVPLALYSCRTECQGARET